MAAVLALKYQSPTSVGVTITPPTGTAPYSYQLKRAPDSSGSPGAFANKGAAVTGMTTAYTFTDGTVSSGVRYWYQVVVVDSAGSPVTTTSNNVPSIAGKMQFGGLRSYVTLAAGDHPGVAGRFLGQVTSQNAVKRVQGLLGQAVETTGQNALATQTGLLVEAVKWRDVLSLALDSVERAILDVAANTGVSPSTFAKTPNES